MPKMTQFAEDSCAISSARIQAALDFANLHHRYTYRKNTGAPYILHPLQVVDRLGRWGIFPKDHYDVWVTGLLHDVVEDTLATISEINTIFGRQVGFYVAELTFRNQHPEETKPQYALAKEDYLRSFVEKSTQSLVIKIADRLCNVEDFLHSDKRYAVKYFDKAKMLFDACTARMGVGDIEAVFGKKVEDNLVSDVSNLSSRIETIRDSQA